MTTRTSGRARIATRLGRLAVRVTGSGPTAVLWHGLFVDSRSWDRVREALGRHRRLVLVDGPGWGDSDALTRHTTMAQCALAAEDLLDGLTEADLAEPGPVDWVGTGWGGHIGYRLAGTRPDRLRTLVATSAPTSPLPLSRRRTVAALAGVLDRVGPVGPLRSVIAATQLAPAGRRNDPGALTVLHASLDRADRHSVAATLRSFTVDRLDLRDELQRSPVPTLLVVGDAGGDLSPGQARDSARGCSHAGVVTIAGARSLVPVERPAEFAAAVLEFWSRYPEATVPRLR